MDRRPLVASAAGGSISSLVLWALQEGLKSTPIDFPVLETPGFSIQVNSDFLVGLLCGFILWPLLELIILTKQWVTLSLRVRIQAYTSGQGGKLYTVLHE